VADLEPIKIFIDADVRLPSEGTPRKVIESLRRHLKQYQYAMEEPPTFSADICITNPFCLWQTSDGQHRMPQSLLPKLTETCRRHGVPFTVIDQRATVPCSPFRSRLRLDTEEQEVIRKLLLRDNGVVVVDKFERQLAIGAELISRRQQRTLVLSEAEQQIRDWHQGLERALSLASPDIAPLANANSSTKIAIGHYDEAMAFITQSSTAFPNDYGLIIFDGLSRYPSLGLMQVIRAMNARYLLGFTQSLQGSDEEQGPIFMVLGGMVHQLIASVDIPLLRLSSIYKETTFDFPYLGRHQYQALVAALAKDQKRAQLIAADIEHEARIGNSCLVLSERRDHLELLAAALSPDISTYTLTSEIRPGERSRMIGQFVEGKRLVLMATGQIAMEAISSPNFNRLFLTFPFSYSQKLFHIVQLLIHPIAGKRDALLYDYDDPGLAPLHRAFEKRRNFLTRLAREADQELARFAQLELPLDPT